jgi:hypothetical protein
MQQFLPMPTTLNNCSSYDGEQLMLGGLEDGMPFIHVKSLPFDPPLNMNTVVEGITKDFASGTGIELEHVTATWEFLSSGNYAVAGSASHTQPEASHPVLVDLLSPDFNQPEKIETMLRTVSAGISERTKVPLNNIFINHRVAHSGMIFDKGHIVRW